MAFQYAVRTDKDTHFTGAIAQNAKEDENISLPVALEGMNGNARGLIRTIMLQSDQNLAWELAFWSGDGFDSTDVDLDTFISRWTFAVADGIRYGGAGQYYYYIEGLALPYVDDDNSGELHLSLVNRSATGKNAGGTGEVAVELSIQPEGFE
jgi:hypothetical protein